MNLATISAYRPTAYRVDLVFNRPMGTPQSFESSRQCLIATEAGDTVGGFSADFAGFARTW
jgi:hypothetical protein